MSLKGLPRTKDGRLVLEHADSETEDDGSHPSSQSARRARAYDSEDVFDDEEMCPHLMDEVYGDARWSP